MMSTDKQYDKLFEPDLPIPEENFIPASERNRISEFQATQADINYLFDTLMPRIKEPTETNHKPKPKKGRKIHKRQVRQESQNLMFF